MPVSLYSMLVRSQGDLILDIFGLWCRFPESETEFDVCSLLEFEVRSKTRKRKRARRDRNACNPVSRCRHFYIVRHTGSGKSALAPAAGQHLLFSISTKKNKSSIQIRCQNFYSPAGQNDRQQGSRTLPLISPVKSFQPKISLINYYIPRCLET